MDRLFPSGGTRSGSRRFAWNRAFKRSSLNSDLERSAPYQAFRRWLLGWEHWLGAHLGTPVRRKPYSAWFDWYAARCEEPPPSGYPSPDYVVVVAHARTNELPPEELETARYRLVKHVEYPYRGVPHPPMGFVNLPVDVYARDPASSP